MSAAPPSYEMLNQLTDDELLEELGTLVAGNSFGFADDDPRKFRQFGEEWFRDNLAAIQLRVCNDQRIQAFTNESKGEAAVGLFAAVVDTLGDLTNSHMAAAVLAVIILRHGLRKLCSRHPSK